MRILKGNFLMPRQSTPPKTKSTARKSTTANPRRKQEVEFSTPYAGFPVFTSTRMRERLEQVGKYTPDTIIHAILEDAYDRMGPIKSESGSGQLRGVTDPDGERFIIQVDVDNRHIGCWYEGEDSHPVLENESLCGKVTLPCTVGIREDSATIH
jgi:hypothetical protein